MHIAGCALLHAPREAVWPLIFDPAALIGLVPGCEQLDQVAPGVYRGQIRLSVAAVGGVYETQVQVLEQAPPERCVLRGEVSGPTGVIAGQARFTLREEAAGTQIEYEGHATITGALGTLSPRFIEGVMRTLLQQGLARLDRRLRSG